MQKERKSFMPLTPDFDDRLERLADAKGVPKLVTPHDPGTGEGTGTKPATVASEASAEKPVTRAPSVRLNLEIPDYLLVELKIKAATEKSTARHLVLSALQHAGYRIDDADMAQDGRRDN